MVYGIDFHISISNNRLKLKFQYYFPLHSFILSNKNYMIFCCCHNDVNINWSKGKIQSQMIKLKLAINYNCMIHNDDYSLVLKYFFEIFFHYP